jgi:hypothetical protein
VTDTPPTTPETELRAGASGSGALLRLGASIAALVAGVAAVFVVGLLLSDLPPIAESATSSPPAGVASPTTTSSSSGGASFDCTAVHYIKFPAPPKGAVVLASEAGTNKDGCTMALGLAVVPGGAKVGLQASVVDPNGDGVPGLTVAFDVTGAGGARATAAGTPCGDGCYRAAANIAKPRRIVVSIAELTPQRVAFGLPATWPPPPATTTVARASRVWRALRSLAFRERLSAGGTFVLVTDWTQVAPDRQTSDSHGAGNSIIIGDRRWDKPEGPGKWQESPQQPITQPVPFWAGQANARLLGTVTVNGKQLWKVSFFDPATPGWFTILVDPTTGHTMQIDMTAAAHFMHDTYSGFNAPIVIVPPPPQAVAAPAKTG